MTAASLARKFLALTLLACLLGALVFAAGAGGATYAELPDPLDRGPYTPETLDPLVLGTQTFQEPNGKGTAATGANATITVPVRGVMYMPHEKSDRSPLIVFVHGNHSSCDSGSGPACTIYKRNDEGYAYLGANLASWGYTVFSLDQDELMARQDGSFGKGMHNRRLLIIGGARRAQSGGRNRADARPDLEHRRQTGRQARPHPDRADGALARRRRGRQLHPLRPEPAGR